MNYWLLIGILIIIIGFGLKIDSIAVVIVAAIVTALIGNIEIKQILETLGSNFISARNMSLFILTLPIVGVCERYGLKEQAIEVIKKMKVITAGKIIISYQFIRELAAAFSLRLGGHAQFIRPLIHPMAEGAAVANKEEPLTEHEIDKIKAASAAADNYGNFFAQNCFAASSGVILIANTLIENGYTTVVQQEIALWSIPIAIIAFILGVVQYMLLDKMIKKKRGDS
jgi:uncharacterized membrane protein